MNNEITPAIKTRVISNCNFESFIEALYMMTFMFYNYYMLVKKKARSVSKLKKKLDILFSRFIRARDNHICYTCGLRMEPNRSQNGHFVPRQYLATRYSEINCHCQCYACNMLYNGQPSAFAINLRRDYGDGIVEELEALRRTIVKDFPYDKWIEHYEKLSTEE